MKWVDKDPARVKSALVDRGYHVRKPALLITGQTPKQRQLFLTNWLTVQLYWITLLKHRPPHQFPAPQLWREFLHSVPPKNELKAAGSSSSSMKKLTKSHKLAVYEIFGEEGAALTQGSSWALKATIEWREKVVPIPSLINPPPLVWSVLYCGSCMRLDSATSFVCSTRPWLHIFGQIIASSVFHYFIASFWTLWALSCGLNHHQRSQGTWG